MGDSGFVDGRGIVDGFVIFGSSPVDHVVGAYRQLQGTVVFTVDVAVDNGIVAVEHGFLAVDVVAVVGRGSGIARVDFEDSREGVLVERVGNAGAHVGCDQFYLGGLSRFVILFVVVATGRNSRQEQQGGGPEQNLFHNTLFLIRVW